MSGPPTEDIVARLRWSGQDAITRHVSLGMHKLHAEAADEIDRLREALRPLAAWATILNMDTPDDHRLPDTVAHVSLTMGHAREAAKALGWLKT